MGFKVERRFFKNMVSMKKGEYESLQRKASNTQRIKYGLFALLSVLATVLIVNFGRFLYDSYGNIGPQIGTVPVTLPSGFISTFFSWFGISSTTTVQALIAYFAVLLILLFAFKDIVQAFSSFSSETTSWAISIGLSLLAAVSGVNTSIVEMFSLTSSIAAGGVAIIVLTAVFAAIVLNLGLGKNLQSWVFKRKMLKEAYEVQEGAEQTARAIKGLRTVEDSFK